MQRATLFIAGMLALIGVLISAAPARAQNGAIAFDDENCAWGRSWNYSTAQQAATVALQQCRYASCEVLAQIGPRQCGSLATTATCKGWGWSTRPTLAEAQAAALQDCASANAGYECIARVGDCNR
jgi:hypothetical protein